MERPIDRILNRLKEIGMNKTTASTKAGFSPGFLRSLEINPERNMSGEQAKALAPVIRKSPQWILFAIEDDYEQSIEAQFRLDTELLQSAWELAEKDLIKYGLADQESTPKFKFVAYHYEVLYRKMNNLPPLDPEND